MENEEITSSLSTSKKTLAKFIFVGVFAAGLIFGFLFFLLLYQSKLNMLINANNKTTQSSLQTQDTQQEKELLQKDIESAKTNKIKYLHKNQATEVNTIAVFSDTSSINAVESFPDKTNPTTTKPYYNLLSKLVGITITDIVLATNNNTEYAIFSNSLGLDWTELYLAAVNPYTTNPLPFNIKSLGIIQTNYFSSIELLDYFPITNQVLFRTKGGDGCGMTASISFWSNNEERTVTKYGGGCGVSNDDGTTLPIYLGYSKGLLYLAEVVQKNLGAAFDDNKITNVFTIDPVSGTKKTLDLGLDNKIIEETWVANEPVLSAYQLIVGQNTENHKIVVLNTEYLTVEEVNLESLISSE